MLATFVADVFRKSEANQIAFVLDEHFSPLDAYGWSSAGLYCFWDVETREIYYIGLANDLAQRFREHTGISRCDPNSCKVLEIAKHFQSKELLGFTVFSQSTTSQPIVSSIAHNEAMRVSQYEATYGKGSEQPGEHIKLIEGLLIETHKKRGKLPAWNKTGGASAGAVMEYKDSETLLSFFNVTNTGPLLARTTLRDFVTVSEVSMYEAMVLHSVRVNMLYKKLNFKQAFESTYAMDGLKERILEVGYLDWVPDLSGIRRYELKLEIDEL